MKPQIEYFAKKYKVIVVQGKRKERTGKRQSYLHADDERYSWHFKSFTSAPAYVVGRSDGAVIALLLAIYYPDKVKKAVAFAANLTPDTTALYPYIYNEVIRDKKQAEEMMAKKTCY
jgi:pimeloyl-ACP methyl ester carboxylesterase